MCASPNCQKARQAATRASLTRNTYTPKRLAPGKMYGNAAGANYGTPKVKLSFGRRGS